MSQALPKGSWTRRIAIFALAALAIAVLWTVLMGGEDTYEVNMQLENAGGLRNGSPVVVGGVQVGEVELEAEHDSVEVTLKIDQEYGPIGTDASAAIISQNALGQKQVRIELGNTSEAAPEGYTIPAEQVAETVDIDQLLSTFDADTRTRLAILINETGTAFAGRELDFKSFLRDFAPALSSGGEVLEQLTDDNEALSSLLATSDRYIATLADERERLGRMLDTIGQTTETVAARRTELLETLRGAPSALISTREFLAELRHTTGPLADTARLLTETAPSLENILDSIEPFRAVAVPALDAAVEAAPGVTGLAELGLPPVEHAQPAVEEVSAMAFNEIPPVGSTLDRSMDNLLATLENWSRAIQFRDRMSHIFRGEATFSPQLIERYITGFGGPELPTGTVSASSSGSDEEESAPSAEPAEEPETTQPAAEPEPEPGPDSPIAPLEDLLDNLLEDVTDPLRPNADPDTSNAVDDLIDFLFGGGAG